MREALDAEAEFVLTLGGLALRVRGALLVTHEKIPVPRFNYVQVDRIGAERQTAFFERALDHYFQRALRPTFRLPQPVEPHLDHGLRRLGFVPRTEPLSVMLEGTSRPPEPAPSGFAVRPARDAELDEVAAFWTGAKERLEFRTAVDVAWHHPHPDEQLVPLLATADGEIVAAALLYRHGATVGIHFVATHPSARGRGAASELVRYALKERPLGGPVRHTIVADSARLEARLRKLGFGSALSFAVYELPRGAELALPSPGPPGPPRWRPPRS